ncbi:hypothetical protein V6N13_035727 [Hibiscus sabdariffa]|uniref:Uncharacterized protein n=1 Tax=Hibiscus sabdariffa TaxID=183260 RepID=A0ABR2S977_9ROSI
MEPRIFRSAIVSAQKKKLIYGEWGRGAGAGAATLAVQWRSEVGFCAEAEASRYLENSRTTQRNLHVKTQNSQTRNIIFLKLQNLKTKTQISKLFRAAQTSFTGVETWEIMGSNTGNSPPPNPPF